MRPLIAAAAVLALAACAPTSDPQPTAPDGATTAVEVSATYRERILLPPGHVLTVRVEDVSLADAPARVMAEKSIALEGRGPPYDVTLQIPNAQIDPRHTYAARADIKDPQGSLRFVTDTRYVVLTQGAQNRAEITMVVAR